MHLMYGVWGVGCGVCLSYVHRALMKCIVDRVCRVRWVRIYVMGWVRKLYVERLVKKCMMWW